MTRAAGPPSEVDLAPGTLVIGDLHLDLDEARDGERFAAWLARERGAPRLVILGDLFEYWLGPAHERTSGAEVVLGALAAWVRDGGALDVIPGNRDFLLDERFARATGATLWPAGFVGRTPAGERVLFVHGDELCTLDWRYQRLRRVLRSRALVSLAPRLPRPLLASVARRLRRASRRAVAEKSGAETEQQPAACRALASAARAGVLVCGHAHRFRDERLADGPRWLVVDAFGGRRDTLVLTPGGFEPRAERSAVGGGGAVIVAIDGPAGAGKSTVAARVAQELGLAFLDTGAMYRAVTLVVLERGIHPSDAEACSAVARTLRLAFDGEGRILIEGVPGEPDVRSQTVTLNVSAVSAHGGVREAVVARQRELAQELGGVVAEGRDTTTVVFPRAEHKFFLVASPEERARRRTRQEGREGERGAFESILADIQRRDRLDATRAHSPLLQAPDALVIDAGGQSAEEVVQAILACVRAGRGSRSG